jgi:hypothetical protein
MFSRRFVKAAAQPFAFVSFANLPKPNPVISAIADQVTPDSCKDVTIKALKSFK